MVPRTVAVVGASSDRRKFGNKALRAFQEEGHRVIPINPHEAAVEGLPAYASVLDVPGPIDMATVYVQPEVGVRLLRELLAEARRLKLNVITACSVVALGRDPNAY